MSTRKHVAFDLDGTLANSVRGAEHDYYGVGEPIEPMIKLLKAYLEEDKYDVKILTARVAPTEYDVDEIAKRVRVIKAWCLKHIGRELEVTCMKDGLMELLYDDRAVAVDRNTGKICHHFDDDDPRLAPIKEEDRFPLAVPRLPPAGSC